MYIKLTENPFTKNTTFFAFLKKGKLDSRPLLPLTKMFSIL